MRRATVDELLEPAVIAGGDERLRVDLHRELRRDRVIDAGGEGDGLLIEVPENVAAVGGVFDPL